MAKTFSGSNDSHTYNSSLWWSINSFCVSKATIQSPQMKGRSSWITESMYWYMKKWNNFYHSFKALPLGNPLPHFHLYQSQLVIEYWWKKLHRSFHILIQLKRPNYENRMVFAMFHSYNWYSNENVIKAKKKEKWWTKPFLKELRN